MPLNQRIEDDVHWGRIVRLELLPHPKVKHPEAIKADNQMKDGMLVLDLLAPLVSYALRKWAVDCTPNHALDPRSHHLYLSNSQTLYGVESAALVPGFSALLK
jgi:hypothetical protein